jgi:ATP-dependent RNA helicase CshB
MIGLIAKKKKKIKPGYKHQINQAIKRKDQMDRRIAERTAMKARKKANKAEADRKR